MEALETRVIRIRDVHPHARTVGIVIGIEDRARGKRMLRSAACRDSSASLTCSGNGTRCRPPGRVAEHGQIELPHALVSHAASRYDRPGGRFK